MPLVLPRRSLSIDFVRDGQASGDNYPTELSKLDALFTFARASTATRFNAAGVLETVASGQPRFDFDPVTLACKGLLIEEARTNLLFPSAPASWTPNTGVTVTNNYASAPDGSTTAMRVQYNGTGAAGDFRAYGPLLATSTDVRTQSLWMKSLGAPVTLLFGSGMGSVSINVTTQWTRFNITSTGDGVNSWGVRIYSPAADNTAFDIAVAGQQLEAGSFATSYIPTTSAAVTRAVESCYTTQMAPWYNPAAQSIIVEMLTPSLVANYQCAMSLYSDVNNRIECYNHIFEVVTAGAGQSGFTTAWAASAVIKDACSFASGRIAFSQNGAAVIADTGKTFPPAATRLNIGMNFAATYHLNGHIRRLAYLPYAVSDTLLKQLST